MNPNTVVAGDCIEVMASMPPLSVDAIITDPPFAMPADHYEARADWRRKWSDASILGSWFGSVVTAAHRVLKPNGQIAVFTNHAAYSLFYPPLYDRWPATFSLVWDKGRPGMGRVWRKSHELIIVGRYSDSWAPEDGVLRTDVLRFSPTPSADRVHPVQKPVTLLRSLVESMVPPGGTVLDPFAGSGTTIAAAIAAGRIGYGIELDENYADLANRHLRNLVEADGQLDLVAEGGAA